MKYILQTKRLLLRELSVDDENDLSLILSDPESMKYYPQVFTRDQVRNWIKRNMDSYKKYNHGLWAIILREGNVFLGDCGITIQNIDGEELPELGYHIRKDHWNKGYASEASKACIEYAFKVLNYDKIYSYTRFDNKPSIRVAEKNGMRFIKYFEKFIMDVSIKEALFCIDRKEIN